MFYFNKWTTIRKLFRFLCMTFLLIFITSCTQLDVEQVARNCVNLRLDSPLCNEAKLAVVSGGVAGGSGANRVCVGGNWDGNTPCQTNADCSGVCWQGPNSNGECTSNFECNTNRRTGSNLCERQPTKVCDDIGCPNLCEYKTPPVPAGANLGRVIECTNDVSNCTSGAMRVCDMAGPRTGRTACSTNNTCRNFCGTDGGTPDLEGDDVDTPIPCQRDSECPGGLGCITDGFCPADPINYQCSNGQRCLNDWVICIGRGYCVPGDRVNELPL